jgi:hypothetical protein
VKRASLLGVCAVLAVMAGCKEETAPSRSKKALPSRASAGATELAWDKIPDGAPYVPPQCYTKTRDDSGKVHNPCFTCHVTTPAPNYIDDGKLQLEYSFAPPALDNRWTNLFVDRSAQVAAISDPEITAYARESNYAGLITSLATLPAA